MEHAEYLAHVEALEANLAALCAGDTALRDDALDKVDRATWGTASHAETMRKRHVRALADVIREINSGDLQA